MTPQQLSPDEWREVQALDIADWDPATCPTYQAFLDTCSGIRVEIEDDELGYTGPVYFLVGHGTPYTVLAASRTPGGTLRPIQLGPYLS